MTAEDLDAWLSRSLEDQRFSRSERQALGEFLASPASSVDREMVRRRAFDLARAKIGSSDAMSVLDWLEAVNKAIREVGEVPNQPVRAEAYFSPGDGCPRAIDRLLTGASATADICVFTITDDRIADAILDAHRRGIAVRIITDDAKSEDLGSDVERFEQSGIPTRVDRSPFHMHHKFAIFDSVTLLTGSYNWTRGAARDNEENLIVTSDRRLLDPFQGAFERLWMKLTSSP